MTTPTLPQTYTAEQICEAFGITDRKLKQLMTSGRVGFLITKKRKRRFLPEHLTQIQAALEVKPTALSPDELTSIGLTPRAAAIRRRRAQN